MHLAGRAIGNLAGAFTLGVFLTLVSILLSAPAAEAARIVNLGPVPAPAAKATGERVLASPARALPASGDSVWTREKMLNARPAAQPGPGATFDISRFGSGAAGSAATGDFTPRDVTAFPNRIHGKVFFQIDPDGPGEAEPEHYTCSGTVVESRKRNVVFTAGHCVFDQTTRDWVQNIIFVPGYENGQTPFGIYYGHQLFTTPRWAGDGNNSYDIGLITLQEPIEELGARKIAFDLSPKVNKHRREFTIYGYPSLPSPRFDGEVLRACRASFRSLDSTVPNAAPFPLAVRPCQMRQGASGGGWITRGNFLNSVVSYGYCDNLPRTCGTIFGPVFSNAAKALYTDKRVGGSPRPTVKLLSAPPRVVRKRKVRFRFSGEAATPVRYLCRLDRQRKVACSSRIAISQLRPGKHILRVQAIDQTDKASRNRIVHSFRVKLPRR